jgi:hypothetical protein
VDSQQTSAELAVANVCSQSVDASASGRKQSFKCSVLWATVLA